MPSCRPDVISAVLYKVMEFRPKTILDVGAGHGKWGCLITEYLKYWCGIEPVIDAVEPFKPYVVSSAAYNFYRRVHNKDVVEMMDELGEYDLVLLVDVIEHIPKDKGRLLLRAIENHYIVSTPAYHAPQGAMFGNGYEEHVSRWNPDDFVDFEFVSSRVKRSHIIAWK